MLNHNYCETLTNYCRLKTKAVKVGNLSLGNYNPILIQTMTTTPTLDTKATVKQIISCVEAGADIVRVTTPSINEANNLKIIKQKLNLAKIFTPIVADIHYTPNAAEVAARLVEKVRINPGNYVDKKKFEIIEYSDADYLREIEFIATKFIPLINICKEYGTCIRIGTNHGSLSDRIMSRFGDTPLGMVESALEFIRIARQENFHQLVISMKSSNPIIMVKAYRLLVNKMLYEFGEVYPLHLGVTEAGDGEDGRLKSTVGIGALLQDGLGDTIRVSLTEDPELEIPVAKDILNCLNKKIPREIFYPLQQIYYNPFEFKRQTIFEVENIGMNKVPIVIANFANQMDIDYQHLQSIGYTYNVKDDKWNTDDRTADFIYTKNKIVTTNLPPQLKVIIKHKFWRKKYKNSHIPYYSLDDFLQFQCSGASCHFVLLTDQDFIKPSISKSLAQFKLYSNIVFVLDTQKDFTFHNLRLYTNFLLEQKIFFPRVYIIPNHLNVAKSINQLNLATCFSSLMIDGAVDGLFFDDNFARLKSEELCQDLKLKNNFIYQLFQVTKLRISKTEYISCPSCGRTLFNLQETTQKIKEKTQHLKGVKIAVMGCIVNGPGEMADADFGYVGSGINKVSLYQGKEVVKRNVPTEKAVDELILLIKSAGLWINPITTS